VARRINDATVVVLDAVVTARGDHPCLHPLRQQARADAYGLRYWCPHDSPGSCFTSPARHGRRLRGRHLRDELLAMELFDTLLEARVLVEDWRSESTAPPGPQRARLLDPSRVRRGLGDYPTQLS
jgi:hypothetical protein